MEERDRESERQIVRFLVAGVEGTWWPVVCMDTTPQTQTNWWKLWNFIPHLRGIWGWTHNIEGTELELHMANGV